MSVMKVQSCCFVNKPLTFSLLSPLLKLPDVTGKTNNLQNIVGRPVDISLT